MIGEFMDRLSGTVAFVVGCSHEVVRPLEMRHLALKIGFA